jgi:acyl carrier protein
MSDCIQEIRKIFCDVLLREVKSETADLLESGVLDSIGLVDLLFTLEQRFGFAPDIAELDLENFRSIQKIAELVSASSKNGLAQIDGAYESHRN